MSIALKYGSVLRQSNNKAILVYLSYDFRIILWDKILIIGLLSDFSILGIDPLYGINVRRRYFYSN